MSEQKISDSADRDRGDQRLRAAVAMAPLALFETDLEGRVSWVNEYWGDLVGVSPADALHKPWFAVVHPEDLQPVVMQWHVATAQRVRVDFECRVILSDHDFKWIRGSAKPLDAADESTAYMGMAIDVSDKHRLDELTRAATGLETWAEQSAAALAEKTRELGIFAALIDSSADAIAIVDPGGLVRYANPAFRMLFEIDPEVPVGDIFLALGLDVDTAVALRKAMDAGTSFGSSVTLERPTLVPLHADVNSFSIVDSTSKNMGMAVTVRDLSQHWEAEQERMRLHAEIIATQEAAIRELSTPLLPIAPHVIAMPLIGSINASRGQQILETLLTGIGQYQAEVAILDVTGVRQMDAEIAEVLMRTAQAARMLGADVILTGLSPLVARTLIGLGVDVSAMRTLATLEQGIHAALARNRLRKTNQPPRTNRSK